MDDYQIKLNGISKKIGVLIARHNELRVSYRQLEEENERLKKQLKAESKKYDQLSEDIKVVKLSKQISGGDDSNRAELKKKINEFIKEIDNCVAMLND